MKCKITLYGEGSQLILEGEAKNVELEFPRSILPDIVALGEYAENVITRHVKFHAEIHPFEKQEEDEKAPSIEIEPEIVTLEPVKEPNEVIIQPPDQPIQ